MRIIWESIIYTDLRAVTVSIYAQKMEKSQGLDRTLFGARAVGGVPARQNITAPGRGRLKRIYVK